jgi:hypothetical protein
MSGDEAGLTSQAQVALAKLEIREALIRWCRGLDRGDSELLASAYHPDAVDEHGTEHYSGISAGPGYVAKHMRKFRRHLHTLSNETIEVDGDHAMCESYSIAYLVVDDPNDSGLATLLTVGGRYFDRFERRDGGWKIARRKFVVEWRTTCTIEPRGLDGPYEGRRDSSDPSYFAPDAFN